MVSELGIQGNEGGSHLLISPLFHWELDFNYALHFAILCLVYFLLGIFLPSFSKIILKIACLIKGFSL